MIRDKVDWKYFTNEFHNRNPKNLINYIEFLDKKFLNRNDISEEFLVNFQQFIDLSKLDKDVITASIIRIYENELNWDTVSTLSRDIVDVELYKDRINWEKFIISNDIDDAFIRRYKEYIDFRILSWCNGELSNSVLSEFENELDWSRVPITVNTDPALVLKHLNEIGFHKIAKLYISRDEFIFNFFDEYLDYIYEFEKISIKTPREFVNIINSYDSGFEFKLMPKSELKFDRGDKFYYNVFIKFYDVTITEINDRGIYFYAENYDPDGLFIFRKMLYWVDWKKKLYRFDESKREMIQHKRTFQHIPLIDFVVLFHDDWNDFIPVIDILVNNLSNTDKVEGRNEMFKEINEVVKKYKDWNDDEGYLLRLSFDYDI